MKKSSLADRCITGLIIMIGMAETGHLLMVFGHRPFSDAVHIFVAGLVAALLLFVGHTVIKSGGAAARSERGKTPVTTLSAGALVLFILLFVYQIMTVTSENTTERSGDMMVETVESILETGEIYGVNPLTGREYTAGVPLKIRILGLPTMYAILCRISGIAAWDMLCKWVPLLGLGFCYLAFWTLAGTLFPEKKDREARVIFMVAVAAVLCAGGHAFGMDGSGLLYRGYRGTTLRGTILLPYTLGLCLRRRWKQTILCVLAEACIVWTLYGMGVCLFVAFGMGAVRLWQIRRSSGLHATGDHTTVDHAVGDHVAGEEV